ARLALGRQQLVGIPERARLRLGLLVQLGEPQHRGVSVQAELEQRLARGTHAAAQVVGADPETGREPREAEKGEGARVAAARGPPGSAGGPRPPVGATPPAHPPPRRGRGGPAAPRPPPRSEPGGARAARRKRPGPSRSTSPRAPSRNSATRKPFSASPKRAAA